MAFDIKTALTDNVIRLLRERTQKQDIDRKKAITELVNLGMHTGNAQRLMDDVTDVQLSRLGQVADKLRVPVAELLAADRSAHSSAQTASLEQALPVVLDALAKLTSGQWNMVRARLDDMPGHPEAGEDVAADVLPLLNARHTKPQIVGA